MRFELLQLMPPHLIEITKEQRVQAQIIEFPLHNNEQVDQFLLYSKYRLDDMRVHTLNLHKLTTQVLAEKGKKVDVLLES